MQIRTTALCAAMQGVGGGLGWSLVPPLMPLIATDLHLSPAMGGVVWGAAALGIAVAAPLGGALVDRHGPRRIAGAAMMVGALACALRVFATGGWSLAATMLLFGMHVGFVAPAIPKALGSHVPLAKLGRANGIALLAYTLGTALTVLTARTVIAPALGGWRPAMIAAAIAMAITGAIWLVFLRDGAAPARHGRLTDGLALLRNPDLRRVGGIHFLLFGGYLALLGMLPRALGEAGLPPASVGLAVASWLAVAAVANLAGPWLSDRLGRRRPFFFAGGVLAGAALAGLAVAPVSTAPALLAIAAIGGGSFAPLVLAMPLELPGIGAARAGAALGLLMLIGQIGGFLLPILTGTLAGAWGFPAALGALAVVHVLIVVPALRLRETGRSAASTTPVPAASPAPAAVA